jgi:hypothetical protein
MSPKWRYITRLFVIYLLMLAAGMFLIRFTVIDIEAGAYVVMLSIMTMITLGAYLLVTVGSGRKESDQGFFLLAGMGGKFLAYLIMILIFWMSGKNTTTEFIIAFFVLYLVLTIFLVRTLYKTLKIN